METIKLIINNDNTTIIDLNTDSTFVLPLRDIVEKYYKNKRVIIKEVDIQKNKLTGLEENYINLLKQSDALIENDVFEAQILIPYRATGDNLFRKEQLHKFLKHMTMYLNTVHPYISYKLIIVEQNNNHMFNRGLLLNIGYLEREKEKIRKDDKIKYYIHHNCDLFPNMTQSPSLDYSFTPINEVRDIFGYSFGIGGIAIFNRLTFKKVKGFPNNYFNWGAEDTNLYRRCEKNSIQIKRPLYNIGIHEEPHDRDSAFNSINKRKGENDDPNLNGLDTCEYMSYINTESEFNYPNVIHYLVDFNYSI